MISLRSTSSWLIASFGLLVAALLLFATTKPFADVKVDYGMVIGDVSVDGKPLAAGTATFHQPDGKFFGTVVENGRFRIDRAPVGRSLVTILGKHVPRRYSTPERSDLKVRIVSDVGNQFIFDLAGDVRGVPLPEDDPLLRAIEERLGEPDYVTVNDQFRLQYRLSNGDTLTLVVSDDKVIGIEHLPLFD